MRLSTGEIIYTDPLNWDTDGDGLKDGEEILSQYKLFSGPSLGFLETSYNIYFSMKSNPTMSDSDGDGISDKNDKWNPDIWSESNPSDLRYKVLNPMNKNTLESLYPELKQSHNSNINPVYISIKDNTITIDAHITLKGAVYNRLKNTSKTYGELVKEGIEELWSGNYIGTKYDFVDGLEFKVIVNTHIKYPDKYYYERLNQKSTIINIDDTNPQNYSKKYPIDNILTGNISDVKDYISFASHSSPWATSSQSEVTLYKLYSKAQTIRTVDSIFGGTVNFFYEYANEYSVTEFKGVVAHEFGHVMGVGDAYLKNSNGYQLKYNDEMLSGDIMYSNARVNCNDIELVLEAYSKNQWQNYSENNISSVIRYPQEYNIVQ